MNVILTVLNRLFDEENTDFYIGNKDKTREISNTANKVLNNINKYSLLTTRKNIGTKTILGANALGPNMNLKRATPKPKRNKQTRKRK